METAAKKKASNSPMGLHSAWTFERIKNSENIIDKP